MFWPISKVRQASNVYHPGIHPEFCQQFSTAFFSENSNLADLGMVTASMLYTSKSVLSFSPFLTDVFSLCLSGEQRSGKHTAKCKFRLQMSSRLTRKFDSAYRSNVYHPGVASFEFCQYFSSTSCLPNNKPTYKLLTTEEFLYNFRFLITEKVLTAKPEICVNMLTKFMTFSLTLLALPHLVLAQEIPYNQEQQGQMSFYIDKGNGACGKPLDASSELLVALSKEWFANDANPNDDPVCKDVCVKATYEGNSITVPVKDKCGGCPKTKVDMSQEAFKKLGADLSKGVVDIKWQFVKGPCEQK